MTRWVVSADASTVDAERARLPRNMQRHPQTGEWVRVTEENAADFDLYPLQANPQPDRDHVRSVENQGPGVFVETWTFDQDLADQNAEDDARRIAAEGARNRSRWFDERADLWHDAPPADDQQSIMDQINAMHLDLERAHNQLAELTFSAFGAADEDAPGATEAIERIRKRTEGN